MLSSKLQLTIRDRKVLAAILSLIILSSCLSAFIAYNAGVNAQSGSAPTMQTQTSGIYAGSPTYTIWNDSGTVYAKDSWGAIQSGWTSSTNALTTIQAAESAMTSGGEIYFKAGTYSIGTSSVVPGQSFLQGLSVTHSAITLTGEGDASILKLAVGNSRVISNFNGADNFKLSNMRIDGSNLNVHGGATADGLVTGEGANGQIQSCTFINGAGADAFGTYNTGGWKISNINVQGCQHGIVFTESSRNTAYGVTVSNGQAVGFLVTGGADGGSYSNTLENCIAYSNGQDGFQLSKANGNSVYWTNIVNCQSFLNSWSGLNIYGAGYTTVTSSQFYQNTGDGIMLSDDGVTASGYNSFINVNSFGVNGVQNWGLEEKNNTFSSIVSGGFYNSNSFGGIRMINGNSHADLCWNQTNWLT